MKKVIALLVSDLHLSMEPPIARSGEDNWLEAQRRYLDQLSRLSKMHQNCPVFIAGDIFHRWNSPPELINLAMGHLPKLCYTIPGQHDLSYHRLEDMHKTAYGTLKASKRIIDMSFQNRVFVHHSAGIEVVAFPWGRTPSAVAWSSKPGGVRLVMAHSYCWMQGASFPGAKPEHNFRKYNLKGAHVALFGDNHIPFVAKHKGVTVYNHGCFIPRASNERKYPFSCGMLMEDGSLEVYRSEHISSQDVWLDPAVAEHQEQEVGKIRKLMRMLENLGESSEDFEAALKAYYREENVAPEVQKLIEESIHENNRPV